MRCLRAFLTVVLCSVLVHVALPSPASGEPLTFQGVITDGEAPITGTYDLRFTLWDEPDGGTQIGADVVLEDQAIADGLVSTRPDFAAPPDGTLRWLEMSVRAHDSVGAFTVVGDRRALNPLPLALHSTRAGSTNTADDAVTLDGETGDHYLSWENLAGVPGDLADGDDDAVGRLSCAEGQVAKLGPGGEWVCADDLGQVFSRTWVVGPVGSPVENGAALLAAVAAVPAPAGASGAQLVKVEPGRYDLVTSSLALPSWVSLEGSGRRITVIASSVCVPTSATSLSGIVEIATGSEIRGATIENQCSTTTDVAIGLLIEGNQSRAFDLEVRVTGTSWYTYGIFGDGSDIELCDIAAIAANGVSQSTGICLNGTSAVLTRVAAEGFGPSLPVIAGDFSGLESVRISGSFFRVSGTGPAQALYLPQTSILNGVTVVARSTVAGSATAIDAWLRPGGWITLDGSSIESDDEGIRLWSSVGATPAPGVVITNTSIRAPSTAIFIGSGTGAASVSVTVHSSQIHGGASPISSSTAPVTVTMSQLSGGPVVGTTVQCAGVWDEGFSFAASGCP